MEIDPETGATQIVKYTVVDDVGYALNPAGVKAMEPTFKRLKEEGCSIPVIICSGFLLDMEEFAAETGGRPAEFLQKPFELDRLVSSVSAILETA